MKKKNLVFDFDGTLCSSGDLVYRNLKKYSKKTLGSWESLKDLSSKEVVRTLDLSKLDLLRLIFRIRKDFSKKSHDIPLVEGMDGVLRTLSKDSNLFIMTSNSRKNVQFFLKQNSLLSFSIQIFSQRTIFGKHKGLMKLLSQYSMDPEQTYYIGDETRDVEAARKCGIKSVSVAWGYNSRKALSQMDSDFLLEEPSQLIQLLGI